MIKDPAKFAAYKNSGETMFGLDRHAGHSLYYTTPRKNSDVLTNLPNYYNGSYKYRSIPAQNFWSNIDNANARNLWNWNFKGGDLAPQLRADAGRIMYAQYEFLANKYLTNKARAIVENNPVLALNFAYAVWNGSGRFQTYAKEINEAINKGLTDPQKLAQFMINLRVNSANNIVSAQGKKIQKFYDQFYLKDPKQNNNWLILAGLAVAYLVYQK
jgi:hypothetical protein